MPKTKIQYTNQIKFNASGEFLNYMNIARASSVAKDKFGKHPTQTEFLRGIIYEWIKTYTPEIIIDDLKGNVPEILEHKKLKEKHEKTLGELQKLYKKQITKKNNKK